MKLKLAKGYTPTTKTKAEEHIRSVVQAFEAEGISCVDELGYALGGAGIGAVSFRNQNDTLTLVDTLANGNLANIEGEALSIADIPLDEWTSDPLYYVLVTYVTKRTSRTLTFGLVDESTHYRFFPVEHIGGFLAPREDVLKVAGGAIIPILYRED